MTKQSRYGRIAIGVLIFLSGALSVSRANADANLVLELRPLSEAVTAVRSATILYTVRNIGDELAYATLPYPRGSAWVQELTVYRDGKALPYRADLGHVLHASVGLQSGEQVTAVVALKEFFADDPVTGPGYGRYEAVWRHTGGPLMAAGTKISFTVSADAASRPDWIDTLTVPGNGFSADAQQRLWDQILQSPSNPRWVYVLPSLSYRLVAPESILKLLRASRDVGVRREALLALQLAGVRPEYAPALLEVLKEARNEALEQIGWDTFWVLNGRAGDSEPVRVMCQALEGRDEACPLLSTTAYWTQESRWVPLPLPPSHLVAQRLVGATERKLRSLHPSWDARVPLDAVGVTRSDPATR